MLICSVIGTDGINDEEKVLFSAEARDVQQMDQLLLIYRMMQCIPNVNTFSITKVVPHTEPHEYHLPVDLITYAINSYRRKLSRSNPLLARMTQVPEAVAA